MHNGRDVIDTAFDFGSVREIKDVEIVLTRTRTHVSGSVMDARNAPLRDYVAVIFAEDEAKWTAGTRFIAAARPDQQGTFQILGLPAGQYLAAAVSALEAGQEEDVETLKQLRGSATRLTIGAGETRTLTLKVTPF
jgi:hypothetical protein